MGALRNPRLHSRGRAPALVRVCVRKPVLRFESASRPDGELEKLERLAEIRPWRQNVGRVRSEMTRSKIEKKKSKEYNFAAREFKVQIPKWEVSGVK